MARAVERAQRELRHRLANGLRRERKRLNWTQESTAEHVGFSLQYVQRIERQIVNVPLDTIARFALAMRVDPIELLKLD